ncbi:MAG: hypothetical protein E6J01_02005 [Chloroflexi bacterium]|nr:MAG: hypothetical protein E6J01_02005 [Chloroflexota bacterium]
MTAPDEKHESGPHPGMHVSPGSWWPLTMAIGVALTLTGLVINRVAMVIGIVIGLASLGLWVRDARREFRELEE